MDHKKGKKFSEMIYIFHSDEDACWIAHGLRTDQIGTGISVLDALTDAMRAVDSVLMIARDDPSVAYLREAPQEIQDMAKNAMLLPLEIYEIAHRKVRGQWPEEIQIEVNPSNDSSFTTQIPEEAGC